MYMFLLLTLISPFILVDNKSTNYYATLAPWRPFDSYQLAGSSSLVQVFLMNSLGMVKFSELIFMNSNLLSLGKYYMVFTSMSNILLIDGMDVCSMNPMNYDLMLFILAMWFFMW